MNKKILIGAVAAGGLACGQLLAAAPTKTVSVFDPFALTTTTETVTVTATTSDIGTVPGFTSPTVISSLEIGKHHKPWHKTKMKPHPNPPNNDNGGGSGGPNP